MVKKFFERFYIVFILLFLYAPIMILISLSFNASKSRAIWGGFTLHWYSDLFQNEEIMEALVTTLVLACLSAAIATILGTAAAIAIQNMKKKYRMILLGITNIPLLNADIVTGISLMLIFIAMRYTLDFKSVLISHITFNIPFVILSVMPKLRQINTYTFEAALDLGATPLFAFLKVILPDIFPGVISGFFLAFTMSLDDFVVTYFTKGPETNTLSTIIYTEVRKGINPEIYALSTLMFTTILLLMILINRRNAIRHIVKR